MSDRHEDLTRRGYTVREHDQGFYLYQNGEAVSGPYLTRAAAWGAADDDSYARAMSGKPARV